MITLLRPSISREEVEALLPPGEVLNSPWVVGIRGYYGPTRPGVYDDAIIIITPVFFTTFNGNTIPEQEDAGIAILKPGAWKYRHGIHGLSKPPEKRYPALVQAAPVTIQRLGLPGRAPTEETGFLGINIHRGGFNETLSEGCQTIHAPQWPEFISAMDTLLPRGEIVPYLLVDRNPVPA